MYIYIYIHTFILYIYILHIHIYICLNTYSRTHTYRPTQSIISVPLQVNRFKKIILLIVQYKYSKSCSEDCIQNPVPKIVFSRI